MNPDAPPSAPHAAGAVPAAGADGDAAAPAAPRRVELAGGDPGGLPLRRNRDFLVLLGGQGVSSFGDAISHTALPLLVLALTGSGLAMGIVGALSTLPDLLVGLVAGALADRWDRRRMMLVADLGRALLTALVPISVLLGGPTLLVVYAVAFPMALLRVLWLAAYTAAVPALVGRAQVPRASGVLEAVYNVGWVAGPAIAGLLTAAIGPGPTIAIDAVTYAFSTWALLRIRRPLRPEPSPAAPDLRAEIREGIRFVAHHPVLRAVIAFWTIANILGTGIFTALIFHVTVDRGLGEEVAGIVLSAFAIGSLAGSLLVARRPPRRAGPELLGGYALVGLALASVALRPAVPVVVATALVAGSLNTRILVAYISLRTSLSPDALLGRVGATARTLSVGLIPIGSIGSGLLIDATDGATTLLVIGIGTIAAALLFALVPAVRGARIASWPA